MNSVTIENLDPETAARLCAEAERRGTDVPTTAAQLLREQLFLKPKARSPPFHDLDALAGTWTAEQANEFSAAIVDFDKVDEELWK